MIVRVFLEETMEANMYVVGCEQTGEALLVDAGAYPEDLADFLKDHGLRLTKIFITHGHHDHMEGVDRILAAMGGASNSPITLYSATGRVGNRDAIAVKHGDTFHIGEIKGTVVATPGHTPDGLSLILPGMVFTGDALFSGSVGGTSGPEAYRRQIQAIREHIFTLPDDYEIHGGHGPSSVVWVEKKYNPFFVQ
jgi:glyoxylase-like metal-dependent hydrolase (beta-lactamase superfamily II)